MTDGDWTSAGVADLLTRLDEALNPFGLTCVKFVPSNYDERLPEALRSLLNSTVGTLVIEPIADDDAKQLAVQERRKSLSVVK